mmetsp:Transcript_43655/g.115447  ORF Transcript_43655/g.115447 Transcript_43655/m.115447 type:complete len:271 (-) Transcript_43655:979-1791(-)
MSYCVLLTWCSGGQDGVVQEARRVRCQAQVALHLRLRQEVGHLDRLRDVRPRRVDRLGAVLGGLLLGLGVRRHPPPHGDHANAELPDVHLARRVRDGEELGDFEAVLDFRVWPLDRPGRFDPPPLALHHHDEGVLLRALLHALRHWLHLRPGAGQELRGGEGAYGGAPPVLQGARALGLRRGPGRLQPPAPRPEGALLAADGAGGSAQRLVGPGERLAQGGLSCGPRLSLDELPYAPPRAHEERREDKLLGRLTDGQGHLRLRRILLGEA